MQLKQDRISYTHDDVAGLLQAHWNGAAYRETLVADGMPKAKRNPAQLGTDFAEHADLTLALHRLGDVLHLRHLWLQHAAGLETFEVADMLDAPYEDTVLALEHDMELLVDCMNGHRR